jgi:asparagine synthase (glutamine-hydrolysing)
MVDASGLLWITYNGELYNYEDLRDELRADGVAFRTESDTEVVLEAYRRWGTDCLRRFNGMFAFTIWDEREQVLVCARDPLGIKPFYFSLTQAGFQFASEARAITGGARATLNPDAVTAYFLSMYVPGHLSLFADVHKLAAGTVMRVTRDGRVVTESYWDVPVGQSIPTSPDEAAEHLLQLLDRAVARQLRSDVPVGALLSGGFDSGMVVASAARSTQVLHTYSVGFDDNRQLNELPIARGLAERYGTRHHERVIGSAEVVDLLDRSIGSMSEPAADSAIVPTYCLAEMAAQDGVKVLLSGTGGDEVFAGYTRYVGYTGSRRVLLGLPDTIRALAGRLWPGHPALSARLRHRSLDMMLNTGGSARLAALVCTDPKGLGSYLDRMAAQILPPMSQQAASLYQHMTFDLKVYLPDLLLMLLDQLTMAHTIEGRVPLIDVDLVTASFALPATLHATADRTKLLMRRMAANRVDPRTLTAPKQGFSGPIWRWIADNRELFRERTMAVREVPGCQHLPVDALWSEPKAAETHRWSTEVFLLFVLSTWFHGPRHA